jgi:hypothetical protein
MTFFAKYYEHLSNTWMMIPPAAVKKVKQSLYTPWRRLGGEEV